MGKNRRKNYQRGGDIWSVRNEIQASEVLPKSNKSFWWKCAYGHEWETSVSNRVNGGTNCPYCEGKKATPENSLCAKYPKLMAEWHAKNTISPVDCLPKSHKKVWWLCPKGHEYCTSIASRTHLQTGCPICEWQTSKLEIRVYCELKYILEDVVWRDRSFGVELDVLLPKYKIGIEVDGWYWHRNKLEGDKKKNLVAESQGVSVIRARGLPLPLIGKHDIGFKRTAKEQFVVSKLFKSLGKVIENEVLLNWTNWLNSGDYEKLLLTHGD